MHRRRLTLFFLPHFAACFPAAFRSVSLIFARIHFKPIHNCAQLRSFSLAFPFRTADKILDLGRETIQAIYLRDNRLFFNLIVQTAVRNWPTFGLNWPKLA